MKKSTKDKTSKDNFDHIIEIPSGREDEYLMVDEATGKTYVCPKHDEEG